MIASKLSISEVSLKSRITSDKVQVQDFKRQVTMAAQVPPRPAISIISSESLQQQQQQQQQQRRQINSRDSKSMIIDVEQPNEPSPTSAYGHNHQFNPHEQESSLSFEQRAIKAIKNDDSKTISKLLDTTNWSALSVDLTNLLFACCEYDRKEFLRKLIKLGANVNQTNEDSITCLMIAAKKNHFDAMLVLLSNGAKVNAIDNYEWSALMYASYYGNVECARLLLDAGAFVNVFDVDHLSCLIWASGRGHIEVVKLLLKFGAKVDAADKYGTTPLIWACRKGHNEVVEYLLQAGANVNATGMFGWSALLTTVRGSYLETTKILLRHESVNVNTCDSQRLSPLMIASKDGLVQIAKLLTEKDAFVNLSDRYGHTALIHATKSGHVEIVETLIRAKADIDHIGFDKKSAIFWAVEKGYLDVLSALLRVNPNLEIITNDGETCLIRAVKSKRYDIVRLLLAHGAKVSATDKLGDTVLHTAVRMQSKTLVELLLTDPKNCQLIYKPNKRKETPFSIDQNNPRPIFPSLFDDFENKKAALFLSKTFEFEPPLGISSGGAKREQLDDEPQPQPSNEVNLMSHELPIDGELQSVKRQEQSTVDSALKQRSMNKTASGGDNRNCLSREKSNNNTSIDSLA